MKKLLEGATNLIYRIQISRFVVPKKIFAPKCLEWVQNLSNTDIILEQLEKAHVRARFQEILKRRLKHSGVRFVRDKSIFH